MLREQDISVRLGSLQGQRSSAIATIGKIARIDPILTLEGDSPGVPPGIVVIDATDARHGTRTFTGVVREVFGWRCGLHEEHCRPRLLDRLFPRGLDFSPSLEEWLMSADVRE